MDLKNALVSTGDERNEKKREAQLNVSLINLKDGKKIKLNIKLETQTFT